MGLIFIALAIICTYRAQISEHLVLRSDYMDKENTTALKGIFVIIIFLSHSRNYMVLNGSLDGLYDFIPLFLGQMMVIPFLFYSGFGVMESVKKKGNDYVKGLALYRAGKVLLHFDAAVLLYCLLNLFLGNVYGWDQIFLAFLGWESIGNSHWFIFAIIALYLLSWLVFIVFRQHYCAAVAALFILCAVMIWLLMDVAGRSPYWYDTLIFYPIGVIYSLLRDRVDAIFRDPRLWLSVFCIVLPVFCVLNYNGFSLPKIIPYHAFLAVEIRYFLFFLVFLLFTMRVRVGNKVLSFFGNHVFSIYMLQYIPMKILAAFGVTADYLVFAAGLGGTVLIAVLFDRGMAKLDRVLFCRN